MKALSTHRRNAIGFWLTELALVIVAAVWLLDAPTPYLIASIVAMGAGILTSRLTHLGPALGPPARGGRLLCAALPWLHHLRRPIRWVPAYAVLLVAGVVLLNTRTGDYVMTVLFMVGALNLWLMRLHHRWFRWCLYCPSYRALGPPSGRRV